MQSGTKAFNEHWMQAALSQFIMQINHALALITKQLLVSMNL
jgi:hypothetical protein